MKHYYVYIHTNLKNGKVYVGTTTAKRPESRWGHVGEGYKSHHPHFWAAIQKYGWDEGFSHEYYEVTSAEEMWAEEIRLIALYDATNPDNGYNHSTGGEVSGLGSKHPHSDKTKQKISEALTGKHLSEATKKKLSDVHKGKPKSSAHRKAISEGKKGHSVSDATKAKLSKIMTDGRCSGENAPWYGKHRSNDTKSKLSDLMKGKKLAIGPDGKKHWYTPDQIIEMEKEQ